MNLVYNSGADNIVYFPPLNLMSVSSLETQSQSLLCFISTELSVGSGGLQSTEAWVWYGEGLLLHTDFCWGLHLSSVVESHRLPVKYPFFLSTGTFGPHDSPHCVCTSFFMRLRVDPLPVFTLKLFSEVFLSLVSFNSSHLSSVSKTMSRPLLLMAPICCFLASLLVLEKSFLFLRIF